LSPATARDEVAGKAAPDRSRRSDANQELARPIGVQARADRQPTTRGRKMGNAKMSIQVIGAGFGRTGTDSMREALAILGFGPCHHMVEVNANDEQRRLWRALAQGAAPNWDRLLAGYSSCIDWPSAFYWRELMTHFPQAKVILTYRSPESWWESFEKTILAYINR
jgi:hypothetical protein